jgi:hypothetical protein
MKEFYTRQTANEGVQLPLYHPDGTLSEHWIKVRGVDSDQFRQAEAKAKRKAVEMAQIKDDQERAEAVRETELECIATLVAGWSFPEPCDHNTVVNFLREAPQIADMVNRFAARRAEFFGKKSKSSATGSKRKSSSKSAPKARKRS